MNMQDPIIEIIKKMHCGRCGNKCAYCDCWIEQIIQPERLNEETSKEDAIV